MGLPQTTMTSSKSLIVDHACPRRSNWHQVAAESAPRGLPNPNHNGIIPNQSRPLIAIDNIWRVATGPVSCTPLLSPCILKHKAAIIIIYDASTNYWFTFHAHSWRVDWHTFLLHGLHQKVAGTPPHGEVKPRTLSLPDLLNHAILPHTSRQTNLLITLATSLRSIQLHCYVMPRQFKDVNLTLRVVININRN